MRIFVINLTYSFCFFHPIFLIFYVWIRIPFGNTDPGPQSSCIRIHNTGGSESKSICRIHVWIQIRICSQEVYCTTVYVSDLKPVSRYIRTHLIGTVSRDFDPFVIFLCYSIGAPYEQAKLVYTNSFVLAKILYYKAQNSCVRIVLAFVTLCSIYFQTCKELILDM